MATAIRRLLEPHVARVLVVDSRKAAALAQARAKTDRLDARALARLLEAGVLEQVWAPAEEHAALRRLLARRQALVRARTRAKNEVHASLARTLCPRPPVTDLFGRTGRRWLSERALPSEERLTVEGCLRQVDLFGEEISLLERALAEQAQRSTALPDTGSSSDREAASKTSLQRLSQDKTRGAHPQTVDRRRAGRA